MELVNTSINVDIQVRFSKSPNQEFRFISKNKYLEDHYSFCEFEKNNQIILKTQDKQRRVSFSQFIDISKHERRTKFFD